METLKFVGFSPNAEVMDLACAKWAMLEEKLPVYSSCKAFLERQASGGFRAICDLGFPGGALKLSVVGGRPAKVLRYLMEQVERWLGMWSNSRSWDQVIDEVKKEEGTKVNPTDPSVTLGAVTAPTLG